MQDFFNEFANLPSDGRAANICGTIRAQLAATGTPIGCDDLQIAVIATRATLCTDDFRNKYHKLYFTSLISLPTLSI